MPIPPTPPTPPQKPIQPTGPSFGKNDLQNAANLTMLLETVKQMLATMKKPMFK